MAVSFKKAERKQARLRLALTGPSGSGKTYGALLIAKGIGGKIAVIDTERGSASLYAHLTEFDTLELNPPYTPEKYVEAIHAAEHAAYDMVIIDSLSHEWNGSGGCLEINDTIAKAKHKGNTWSAWNETTPRHRALLDAIIQSKCHIIATLRSKTETAQEKNDHGKTVVVKLGMKSETRDGAEYEFTSVLELTHDSHYATASKDRTELFREPVVLSPEVGKRLQTWLNSGVAVTATAPEKPAEKPVDHYTEILNALNTVQTADDLAKAKLMIQQHKARLTQMQFDAVCNVGRKVADDLKSDAA